MDVSRTSIASQGANETGQAQRARATDRGDESTSAFSAMLGGLRGSRNDGVEDSTAPRDTKDGKDKTSADGADLSQGMAAFMTPAAPNNAYAIAPADGAQAASATEAGAKDKPGRTHTAGEQGRKGHEPDTAQHGGDEEKRVAGSRERTADSAAGTDKAGTDGAAFTDALLAEAGAASQSADATTALLDANNQTPPIPTEVPQLAAIVAPANASMLANTPTVPSLPIASPPGSAAFPAEVSNSIRMLAGTGVQAAELRLTPDDLGQVDVRIRIQDGRADVSLVAQTPEAQAALQQALPRLAEALAGAGLTLGETSVGQQQRQPGDERPHGRHAGGGQPAHSTTAISAPIQVQRGLIDLYA